MEIKLHELNFKNILIIEYANKGFDSIERIETPVNIE